MSYRTLKRALGESNLERKCRWLFGITLGLLLFGSFWWYSQETDKLIAKGNDLVGPRLVYAALLERHIESVNYGTTETFSMGELVKELRIEGFQWGMIFPKNPDKLNLPQDEREWYLLDLWDKKREKDPTFCTDEAIEEYEKKELHSAEGSELIGRSIQRDGKPVYQFYRPVFFKSNCKSCHSVLKGFSVPVTEEAPEEAKLHVGDLMAIIRVEMDEAPIIAAQRENFGILLTTVIITAFLAMMALWAIVRYIIVKPLTHLRDVANAVREGNDDLRAEINTGDEFQELAAAFNRMLRQLLSQQGQLREFNETLDHKVDELAEANLRLFEMNKIKSDFLSTVSHELRTPLNSILGFSEILGGLDVLQDKQKRYAQNIQKSGKMLLDMIDDILNLAKIESGKLDIKPHEFRIESVILDICDLAKPLAQKKNIELACEVPPGMPPMVQDQAKIQQILNNLISNAIKFTPEGGRISVTAAQDDLGDLRLLVEDTGIGISEEEQTLVFEKFRQGTNVLPGGDAMTREYSGTGLGLSIVKELCRLLGGEITLESELGKGSKFRVRLPWTISDEPQLNSELSEDLDKLTRLTGTSLP